MGRVAKLCQTFVTKVGEAWREITFFGEATSNGQFARWSAFDTQDVHRSQCHLSPPGRLDARQKRFWGRPVCPHETPTFISWPSPNYTPYSIPSCNRRTRIDAAFSHVLWSAESPFHFFLSCIWCRSFSLVGSIVREFLLIHIIRICREMVGESQIGIGRW